MATLENLKTLANAIKNATQAGENTANRVGSAIVEAAGLLEGLLADREKIDEFLGLNDRLYSDDTNLLLTPVAETVANRMYASRNAEVGDTYDYSVVGSYTYYRGVQIAVKEGLMYRIHAMQNVEGKLWCFVDENDTVLSIADSVDARTEIDVTITPPAGAKKLILHAYYRGEGNVEFDPVVTIVGDIDKLQDEMDKLQSEVDKVNIINEKLPLGEEDNLFVDCSVTHINSEKVPALSPFMYNSLGQLWGLQLAGTITYNAVYAINSYAVIRIKKTGIAGRKYIVKNLRINEGGAFDNSVVFDENVKVGNLVRQRTIVMGRILENSSDVITLYLAPYEWNLTTNEAITTASNKQHCLYAVDSYTSPTEYTAGELQVEFAKSFNLIGDYTVMDDIASIIDIDKTYYTRPQKLNSQLQGKNVFVFSDSLAYFVYGLAYDWGVNVYVNARGGARMGFESGSGQGGESGTAEQLWLCNDSYVQAVKSALENVELDYIICTAGVNGTLPETDATEVEFIIDNKRWYHDDDATDPWSALSDRDKGRFTSTGCTYAAFYSLCRLFPSAIPCVVAPYRSPGPTYTPVDSELTPHAFAEVLFNENLLQKHDALEDMSKKLGGVFIDCYNATRSSVANCRQYYAESGVHPTKEVAQDMASEIGYTLNRLHGRIAEEIVTP